MRANLERPAVRLPLRRPSYVSRLLGTLLSFEALFLLFFWAGRYKAIPQLAWFPVDLTLFFFLISLVAGAVVMYREPWLLSRIQDQGITFYMLFLLWIVISYLWSSQLGENKEKLTYTLTLLTWSFLGTYIIISSSDERVNRFVHLIMLFSATLLLYWIYIKFHLGIDINNSSYPVVGPNYLGYGEHALCLFLAFFALSLKSGKVDSVFVCVLAMTIILVIMLGLGGKGPLLLALMSPVIVTALIMVKRIKRSKSAKVFQLLLSFAAILLFGILIVSMLSYDFIDSIRGHMRTLDRLLGALSQSDYGGSASSRLDGQRLALDYWYQAPAFGWGIGEYSVVNGFLRYPHNLALEILMELGLVGFAFFASIFGLALLRAWKIWPNDLSDWTTMTLCMLLLIMTLSRFSFQGYLPDERFMFTLAGSVLGLGLRKASQDRQAHRPHPRGRPLSP